MPNLCCAGKHAAESAIAMSHEAKRKEKKSRPESTPPYLMFPHFHSQLFHHLLDPIQRIEPSLKQLNLSQAYRRGDVLPAAQLANPLADLARLFHTDSKARDGAGEGLVAVAIVALGNALNGKSDVALEALVHLHGALARAAVLRARRLADDVAAENLELG